MERIYRLRRGIALVIIALIFGFVAACSGSKGGPISQLPSTPGGIGGVSSGFGEVVGSITDIEGTPVQGATVSIANFYFYATTDDLGNFLIENAPAGTRELFVDGRTATNGRYTSITQDIFVVGDGRITVDFETKLVKVDTDSETLIGPAGGEATNPSVPGLSLSIPAGAVDSDKAFSLTPVPTENLPFPLPGDYQPVFAFWIEPEGTVLELPAELTIGNEFGIAPDERLVLFTTTLEDTTWASSGEMLVSTDGALISTTSGGVKRLPYVVGALLPNIIEGQVTTLIDGLPVLGVTVFATGSFIPTSQSSSVTDQNGRYQLVIIGAGPGSHLALHVDHSDYIIAAQYRTADPFDLKTWGEPVIIEPAPTGDSAGVQTADLYLDRAFLAAEEIALGGDRNNIDIPTNLSDRDASAIELRESSQIDVNELLARDEEINIVRLESIAPLNVNDVILQGDVVATGKHSRALLDLSGEQGFIAVDSKSELTLGVLEETIDPRNRTLYTTTTNGRFYVDFTPIISGMTTASTFTINTGNALVQATDATFTFTQVKSNDVTRSVLEVWRGSVTFTDNIRQTEIEVAAGETELIEISAGDFPIFAPTNLFAAAGLRQAVLTWDSTIEPNVVGYKVYRRKIGDITFDLLTFDPIEPTSTGTETFTDYKIPVGGEEYSYQVTSVNILLNESTPSQIAAARPAAIDLLASSSQAARAVQLTWDDNPNDPFVLGYNVYRSEELEGIYTKINDAVIEPTEDRLGMTYTDDNFPALGTEYYYYVMVRHTDDWEGGRSTIISASPSAINLHANETPEIRHVQLTWDDPLASEDDLLLGYNVYRRLITESTYTKLNSDPIPWLEEGMVFDDFNFPTLGKDVEGNPEPRYQYIVRPVRIGNVELTSSDIATIGPLPIDVTVDNLDREVALNWTDTALDPDNIGYHIWRSQSVPDQAVFPDDFIRLNQIPVPVSPDDDADGVETYGYNDNTVKNFDYTYVITPIYEIENKMTDLAPSPGIVGSPEFELVQDFYATGMEFITENVGFVWGRDGLVIKTIDGGISFERLPVFSAEELASASPDEIVCKSGDFINANIGFLLYEYDDGTSYIKRTNSGGDSWETIQIEGTVTIADSFDPALNGDYTVTHLNEINFISSAAGYATSPEIPCFLVSGNGGITWYMLGSYPPVLIDETLMTIFPVSPSCISFYNLKNGVAFATGEIVKDINGDIISSYPPHLWWYKDGLWEIQNETRMADSIEDDGVQFDTLVPLKNQILSASTAIAYSFTGEQLLGFNSFFASSKLEDGYSEIGFSFDFFPSDVEFLTFSVGYAIGNGFQNGYILSTDMGGNLWTPSLILPTTFEREFAKLSAVDQDVVFAVSADKLYRTFDGGTNWEEVTIQIYN
ncbi:hypothetical protein J7K50_04145 [bacterium]|nr:hypothetical protein [bacterium]